MRVRGTLAVLGTASLVLVYGACSEARLEPIAEEDGGADPAEGPDAADDPEPAADAASRPDAVARDAAPDAKVDAWPCPAPTSTPSTLDREWVTGPLPPSSPTAAGYAMRTATVCDRTTLLEWERVVTAPLRTWDDAKAYCDALSLGNATDWRLPTRIELLTIVDYGRSSPAIDPVAFPSTPAESFWSLTLMAGVFNDPNAFRVLFDFGHAAPLTKSEPLHVRCVRGGR